MTFDLLSPLVGVVKTLCVGEEIPRDPFQKYLSDLCKLGCMTAMPSCSLICSMLRPEKINVTVECHMASFRYPGFHVMLDIHTNIDQSNNCRNSSKCDSLLYTWIKGSFSCTRSKSLVICHMLYYWYHEEFANFTSGSTTTVCSTFLKDLLSLQGL